MTHTFNLNGRSIRLIVSDGGTKYKKSTGLSIDPKLWNKKAKSLGAKCQDRGVWAKLRLIDIRLNEKEKDGLSEQEINDAMEYAVTGVMPESKERADRPMFWDFFKEWSERDVPSKKDRDLAYRRLSDIMGTTEDWEQIDTAFHARLVQRLNDLGYSGNYQATLIAKLKTVMIEGEKMKYHTNREYKQFSYKWTTADTIALTQDEVDAIWNAKLDGVKARVRDSFIVGCMTAARHSDYSQISKDNIQNGRLTLQFKQRKTQESVIIPVSPKVLEVLKRNEGRVPSVCSAEVGFYMKKICKELGGSFNDIVEITKSEGAKSLVVKKHRYDLVSAHTARRTACTLLYTKYNVPLHSCMLLSGHKTPQNFLKYIKVSKEQNAQILADNPFFK